jgi:hypothetical protein
MSRKVSDEDIPFEDEPTTGRLNFSDVPDALTRGDALRLADRVFCHYPDDQFDLAEGIAVAIDAELTVGLTRAARFWQGHDIRFLQRGIYRIPHDDPEFWEPFLRALCGEWEKPFSWELLNKVKSCLGRRLQERGRFVTEEQCRFR